MGIIKYLGCSKVSGDLEIIRNFLSEKLPLKYIGPTRVFKASILQGAWWNLVLFPWSGQLQAKTRAFNFFLRFSHWFFHSRERERTGIVNRSSPVRSQHHHHHPPSPNSYKRSQFKPSPWLGNWKPSQAFLFWTHMSPYFGPKWPRLECSARGQEGRHFTTINDQRSTITRSSFGIESLRSALVETRISTSLWSQVRHDPHLALTTREMLGSGEENKKSSAVCYMSHGGDRLGT